MDDKWSGKGKYRQDLVTFTNEPFYCAVEFSIKFSFGFFKIKNSKLVKAVKI